jgi:dTDP-4-dehydrorhamnose 3,5-epimerase
MTVRLHESPLKGAFVVVPNQVEDERGLFGRLFDAEVFRTYGLEVEFLQASYSYNVAAGTLRGLHYQREPWAEAKLVRCSRGAVFDVIVDLRGDSPTHLDWFGVELTEHTRTGLYVPSGFAHGFLTLTPGAELHYQISTPYHPESSAGLLWNDPEVAINWPREPSVISRRDAGFPRLKDMANP